MMRFLKKDSQPADESGNITVTFVLMSVMIACLFAAVLDLGLAYTQHTAQENDLAVALDTTKTSASGLLIKNSTWPEKEIANEIVTSLRQNGNNDAVTVWVKEASALQVGNPARRAIGVYVEVSGSYKPMSAGNLIGTLEISSAGGHYLIPYSADTAWRPSTSRAGSYSAASNSSSISYSNRAVPSQVNDYINAALQEINK